VCAVKYQFDAIGPTAIDANNNKRHFF